MNMNNHRRRITTIVKTFLTGLNIAFLILGITLLLVAVAISPFLDYATGLQMLVPAWALILNGLLSLVGLKFIWRSTGTIIES